MSSGSRSLYQRRRNRVRSKLRKVGGGRPRLSVFRSNKHIYAQIVDDEGRRTVAAASTLDKDLRAQLEAGGSNIAAAKAVGSLIATRAKHAGVTGVVFDRGGYIFHGRVRALAEAAREGGLRF